MRIRIRHETRYRYASPVRGLAQTLRVIPRSFEGQYVVAWRVDLSADVTAPVRDDAFANLAQTIFVPGPLTEFSVEVFGEVDTLDTNGIIAGLPEPLPPDVYLRQTPLTTPSPAAAAFVKDAAAGQPDPLAQLHALMAALHAEIRVDEGGPSLDPASAFARRAGDATDHAHLFIAGARLLGVPARYVAGHLVKVDEDVQSNTVHAWAEALIPGLGWVAFDPALGLCPSEHHVRVASGFDHQGAQPVRGVRLGGGAEAMKVEVEVQDLDQAQRQTAG